MMVALAAADDPPLLAVKTVVLNPRNPDKGLPQINGLVTMLDPFWFTRKRLMNQTSSLGKALNPGMFLGDLGDRTSFAPLHKLGR